MTYFEHTLTRLGLTGPEREAGWRWLTGQSMEDVGRPLGLAARSVTAWTRRVGLPARQKQPHSSRMVGALPHVGRRIHNARNFRKSA